MEKLDKKEVIFDYLGEGEIFCQLAEEAAELAQAALEYRDTYSRFENATSATREEAYHNLVEEIADVRLCLQMLGLDCDSAEVEIGAVSKAQTLCRLAKKASELSKAALKCRRAYGYSRNVTPVTKEAAHRILLETAEDVMSCLHLIGMDRGTAADEARDIMDRKVERWHQRLFKSVIRNTED